MLNQEYGKAVAQFGEAADYELRVTLDFPGKPDHSLRAEFGATSGIALRWWTSGHFANAPQEGQCELALEVAERSFVNASKR